MFIVDLFKRLFTQSPKFFRIMQIASLVIAALCWCAVQLINRDAIVMDYKTEQIWVPILDGIMKFFAGSLFASATTTTKAELIDEKTKTNIINES